MLTTLCIDTETRLVGSEAVILIRDIGAGIAAEELPLIFDPFYRSTNSRREESLCSPYPFLRKME